MTNTYKIAVSKANGKRVTETYTIGGDKQFKEQQLNDIISFHNCLGNRVLDISNTAI